MSTDALTAPGRAVVVLGSEEVRIERPSGRKASCALALLRALSKAAPGLQEEMARFRRRYEAENVIELDRAQAQLRYPPLPLLGDDGEPLRDEHGAERMLPSPLDRMSEADWEKAGHKLRLPRTPSGAETIAAVFDHALEVAEEHVYRLLALFTISNEDVARYRREGGINDRLAERADELLDKAYADEVLELAVVCGEVIDEQFRTKTRDLGDRLGNALRLLGIEWKPREPAPPAATSSDGSSSSTPTSSTDSPAPTADGPPTSSSSSPGTSSARSSNGSSETPQPSESSTTPR